MPYILAVDLAAKYSAACAMDDNHEVMASFDSWGKSEDEFLYDLISYWSLTEVAPEVMVIEDLPHGLSYTGLVKDVCRLQGRIVQAMHGNAKYLLFLAPRTWRAHYKMKRGTGPNAVFDAAAKFGYTPPDMTVRAKGNGGAARARKVQSDYCSAYLIARWTVDMKTKHGTFDVPGTSRYGTREIREKEFYGQDI